VRVFLVTSGVILLSLSLWLAFSRRAEAKLPWLEFTDISRGNIPLYCQYFENATLTCREMPNENHRGLLSFDGRYRLLTVATPTENGTEWTWQIFDSSASEAFQEIELARFGTIAQIAWTPDNERIAISGHDMQTDTWGVFQKSWKTLEVETVFELVDRIPWGIAFSPDRKWLALTVTYETQGAGLLVIDLTTFTEYPVLRDSVRPQELKWSPDSKWLLFETASPNLEKYPEIDLEKFFNGENTDLYLVNIEAVINGEEPQITQLTHPGQGMQAAHHSYSAAWSPDSKSIAFVASPLENYEPAVYQLQLDGSNATFLYRAQNWRGPLQWFPIVDLPYRFWLSFLPGLLLVFLAWQWRA
jgi:Tol biopolymer transport system component